MVFDMKFIILLFTEDICIGGSTVWGFSTRGGRVLGASLRAVKILIRMSIIMMVMMTRKRLSIMIMRRIMLMVMILMVMMIILMRIMIVTSHAVESCVGGWDGENKN